MKTRMTLILILFVVLAGAARAQSLLGPGDTRTWFFEFRYDSTLQINHPGQTFGGYVMLDYSPLSQAGSLDYRLEFLEDFTSAEPLLSLSVHHLTGLQDSTGMPLVWVPEFSPPPDAWGDFNGALRVTIESGQMRGLSPQISMLVPGAPGYMDYYEAVVVPEPGTLSLAGLGALMMYRMRRRGI